MLFPVAVFRILGFGGTFRPKADLAGFAVHALHNHTNGVTLVQGLQLGLIFKIGYGLPSGDA